jgi:antitoxin component HigA of HigAB toxin-antitoxin module
LAGFFLSKWYTETTNFNPMINEGVKNEISSYLNDEKELEKLKNEVDRATEHLEKAYEDFAKTDRELLEVIRGIETLLSGEGIPENATMDDIKNGEIKLEKLFEDQKKLKIEMKSKLAQLEILSTAATNLLSKAEEHSTRLSEIKKIIFNKTNRDHLN